MTEVKGNYDGVSKSDFAVVSLPNNGEKITLSSNVKYKRTTYQRDALIVRLLRRLLRTKFPRGATVRVVGAALIYKERRVRCSAVSLAIFSLCAKRYRLVGTNTSSAFVQEGSRVRRLASADLPVKIVGSLRVSSIGQRLASKACIVVLASKILSTLPMKRRSFLLRAVVGKARVQGPGRLTERVLRRMLG